MGRLGAISKQTRRNYEEYMLTFKQQNSIYRFYEREKAG